MLEAACQVNLEEPAPASQDAPRSLAFPAASGHPGLAASRAFHLSERISSGAAPGFLRAPDLLQVVLCAGPGSAQDLSVLVPDRAASGVGTEHFTVNVSCALAVPADCFPKPVRHAIGGCPGRNKQQGEYHNNGYLFHGHFPSFPTAQQLITVLRSKRSRVPAGSPAIPRLGIPRLPLGGKALPRDREK